MNVTFRFANNQDVDLYFRWANDPEVRKNSYQSGEILYENHVKWFSQKVTDSNFHFYVFENEFKEPVGQVRIQNQGNHNAIIGVSIDAEKRSKGLGNQILIMATEDYLHKFPEHTIHAYIKKENESSYRSFSKAGFRLKTMEAVEGIESYHMIKSVSK